MAAPSDTELVVLIADSATLTGLYLYGYVDGKVDQDSIFTIDSDGSINNLLKSIFLLPFSPDTSVSYTVAGQLPAGISLTEFANVRAKLTGTPTVPGLFNVVVNREDGEGNSESLP